MANQRDRKDLGTHAGFHVTATQLAEDVPGQGWAIKIESGTPQTGEYTQYMSADVARAFGAALIAAADHYDAETARLARPVVEAEGVPVCEGGAPDCGPVEHYDSEATPLCQRCYDALEAEVSP